MKLVAPIETGAQKTEQESQRRKRCINSAAGRVWRVAAESVDWRAISRDKPHTTAARAVRACTALRHRYARISGIAMPCDEVRNLHVFRVFNWRKSRPQSVCHRATAIPEL